MAKSMWNGVQFLVKTCSPTFNTLPVAHSPKYKGASTPSNIASNIARCDNIAGNIARCDNIAGNIARCGCP